MTERDNNIENILGLTEYPSSSDDENNAPPPTATQGWQQNQAQTPQDVDEVINLDESSSPIASPITEVVESTSATSAVESRRERARIEHNLFWSAIGNPQRLNSWPKPGGIAGFVSRLSRAMPLGNGSASESVSGAQAPRPGVIEARFEAPDPRPGAVVARLEAQDTRLRALEVRSGALDVRQRAQDERPRQCRSCRENGVALPQPRPGPMEGQSGTHGTRPGAIEARPGALEPPLGTTDGRPAAIDVRPGVIEARPGAIEARPGAIEARPGAIEARPGAIEARPGAIEARPGAIEARPGAIEPGPAVQEARPALFGQRPSAPEFRPLVSEPRTLHEPVPELSQPQPQPSASADMMSIMAFRRLQRYRTYRRNRASSLGLVSRLPPLDQSRESSPRAGSRVARLGPVTVDVTFDRGVVSSMINYAGGREGTRSRSGVMQGAERQRTGVRGAERPRSTAMRVGESSRVSLRVPERPRTAARGLERRRAARTHGAGSSQQEGAAQNDAQVNNNEQSGHESESGRLSPRLPVQHEESQDNSDTMEVDEPNTSSPQEEEAGDGEDESEEEISADISLEASNESVGNESGNRSGHITIDIRRSRGHKRRRESERQRTEAFNLKEFNQNLLRLLECPVCLEWMEPPMLQCRLGHLVCTRCRARLATCPVCRSGFSSVRNRAMESVAELLRYPCRHGCGREARLRRRAAHEASCPRRRYRCPAHACAERAPQAYDELVRHVQRNHAAMIKTGRVHKFSVKVNAQQNDNWLIMAGFGLFNLRIAVDIRTSKILAYVAYIGPKCRAKEFIYEIKIVGQHNGRRLVYTRATHSDLESSSLNVSRQDCFHITLDEAVNFLRVRNRHCQPDRLLDFTVEISKQDVATGDNNSVLSDE